MRKYNFFFAFSYVQQALYATRQQDLFEKLRKARQNRTKINLIVIIFNQKKNCNDNTKWIISCRFLETWQFSLSFNIISSIFLFYEFLKILVLRKKKSLSHVIGCK
jgi:hypothetical protein